MKRFFLPALIIFAVWLTLVKIRPFIIIPHCTADPASCASQTVNALDRYGMGTDSGTAEEFSNYGQITAGILAFFVPIFFWAFRKEPSRLASRLLEALKDLLIVSQVIALNGAMTELIRLIVQRPRPYVYENPSFYGQEVQNYTSFVSGHTSFTTATACALILVLLRRQASGVTVRTIGAISAFVAVSTGVCRVFAGRHFITDVLAGALCGLVSAYAIGSFWGIISYRRKRRLEAGSPTQSG